jgi:hypothetical protein
MKIRLFLTTVIIMGVTAWAGSAFGQKTSMSGGGQGMSVSTTSTSPMISTGIGYYDMGEGGTIAGGYLTGKAAFAQGLGQYNYNTALAIRELEDANKQAIDNQLYAERTYFEMRRLNDEYWLSKNPRSTPEQKVLIDQSRLPRRLTSNELDPPWGVIRWPAVLERPEFHAIREKLNDVFAHRLEGHFGVGSPEYTNVQQFTRDMRAVLDQEYDSMSQMEWIQAKRFIESLGYESRFAPGTVVGVNVR